MARNMCNRVAERFDKAAVDIADQIAERVDGDDDTADPSRLRLRVIDPGRCPLRRYFADEARKVTPIDERSRRESA